MNGPGRSDILVFIKTEGGRQLSPFEEADVLGALGLEGEKADAFMAAFSREFKVDMTGFEPAFHYLEERRRLRPGWPLPLTPLYGVTFPIGVGILERAAQNGRWPPTYPILKPAPSTSWINAPLLLLGLPLAAIAVLSLVRLF